MVDMVLSQATLWRSGLFLLMLIIMMTAESVLPRRTLRLSRWRRWPSNLALIALGSATTRLILPLAPLGVATVVWQAHGGLFGLTPVREALPYPLLIVLSLLVYDFAIYAQHVLFHALPSLWRLHRVHHSDQDYDSTTGFRFHPLEIVLSTGVKIGLVAALGAPPEAFFLFEIILSTCALFNHGNLAIPPRIDRWLRLILVTPDVHRVHHSVHPRELHQNYGFCVPWWDRLFMTYCPAPRDGHAQMDIGVLGLTGPHEHSIRGMLTQPFRSESKAGMPEPRS